MPAFVSFGPSLPMTFINNNYFENSLLFDSLTQSEKKNEVEEVIVQIFLHLFNFVVVVVVEHKRRREDAFISLRLLRNKSFAVFATAAEEGAGTNILTMQRQGHPIVNTSLEF